MPRKMHDGRDDGLEPIESLDLGKVQGFADLLRGMSKTAFGGRALGEAYQVLREMAQDPSCTIVVTVSGAMTVAKMGMVLCEMIDSGLAHVVVSTGAILAHGLSEAVGGVHYKHDSRMSDGQLYQRGYNRVYDTIEMEANLSRAQETIDEVLAGLDASRPTCSSEVTGQIGRLLAQRGQMPSILGCAYRRGVPVYVPALTDSELGLSMAVHSLAQGTAAAGRADPDKVLSAAPAFNPFLDLLDYTRRVAAADRLGIFTIGGGVPRNWAQQVGPFVEKLNRQTRSRLPVPRFRYAVRICPEPDHWGGLSGCSYTEGVSWGKFVSRKDGGRFAEVHCDATIAWPLLIRAVLESRGASASEGP